MSGIAGRFETCQGQPNAFSDQFDIEHSGDIEPMKLGHQDNYYYQPGKKALLELQ